MKAEKAKADKQVTEGMLARLQNLDKNKNVLESEELKKTEEPQKDPTTTIKNESNNNDQQSQHSQQYKKNLYDSLVNTPDADKELRRTYRITKKHVNILRAMKMIDDDKNFRDFIMEAIELLWKVKYRD
jgi:hypothetical protein